MRVVDVRTIESWVERDSYYLGRTPYLLVARAIIERLPGETCLEIGPYGPPLVPGCDTMDITAIYGPHTYVHDAGVTPWPIGGPWDLIVALQVWEHLEGRQCEASREAFRHARHVLLSFPYLWPGNDDHAHIDRQTIRAWTLDRDPVLTWRVASDHPGLSKPVDRILYLFKGDVA